MEADTQHVTKRELYSHCFSISMLLFLTASALPTRDGISIVGNLIILAGSACLAIYYGLKLKVAKQQEKLEKSIVNKTSNI